MPAIEFTEKFPAVDHTQRHMSANMKLHIELFEIITYTIRRGILKSSGCIPMEFIL